MIDNYLNKLNRSPFWGGLIFQAFYKGYGKEFCPLNLHYVILPMIMHGPTRKILLNITKRTDFINLVSSEKLAFIDFQERIWNLNKLTKESLTLLHNQNKIVLKENIEIKSVVNFEDYEFNIKEYLRSATHLGLLINEIPYQEVYKSFKIIP
jgi:hypothetical protein